MVESKQPDDDGSAADAREPIRADYDWSAVAPSTAVVETVAIAADREPTGLEPLYNTIDPDALDTLIRSIATGPPDEDATVTFVFGGSLVTVHRTGSVVVRSDEPRSELAEEE